MDFIGVLFLIGAVWLVGRWIVSIANSIEESNRKRKRQEHINHLRSMSSQYPDAYKEWYGSSYGLTSLSDSELETRAGKSIYSWQTKQREIEAARERKRKEEERKRERSSKASSLATKYPNAVQELVGTRYCLSETQVDTLLSYSETFIKNKEAQIIAEQERLKAEREEAVRKRREEVDRKYSILISSYPNAVEHVKMLRKRSEQLEELYTSSEWRRIQRGSAVANENVHMIALPDSLYEKYEKIAVRHKTIVDWHEKQTDFSKTARNLRDTKCNGWGIYSYETSIEGITDTGNAKDYVFKVWQLFKNSYGLSNNVPYTHLSAQLEKRRQLPNFKTGSSTFYDWVYDEAVDYIQALSNKPTVVICDSQLGSDWSRLEPKQFTYLYEKLKNNQITHIHLNELKAARNLVSKNIIVIELITENSHLKDVCQQIYATIDNAVITYISLIKEYDEEELLELHNIEEQKVKEAARKAREEEERKQREAREAEERRKREAREAEERRKREEARRREQEERDRIYRVTHNLKTNHIAIRNHLSANNIRCLYHFTDRRNLDSIRRNRGLYSWQYCDTHNIEIPYAGGDSTSRSLDCRYDLEDYVRLSFCDDHPMTYRLSQNGYDLVLLKITVDVAELETTLFSDMNATDNNCHYGSTLADLQRVDLNATQQHYLRNTDPLFKKHQAEVLVKTFIPIDKIINIDFPQSI